MPPPRPVLPLWAAIVVSALAGWALSLAFPATGWWPMPFLAVPAALLALIGRRPGGAAAAGFAFGAAFFLVNVSFTARYLGPVPWLALSLFEAALTAVATIPIALAYRWLPTVRRGAVTRWVALPALVAGLWTARELLLGAWPYGGFPWGRVGVTQVDGPFAAVASWTGITGLGFLVAFVGAVTVAVIRERPRRRAVAAVPAAVVIVALAAAPPFPTSPAGSMRIGAVQGNGPAGYFDVRTPNAVLEAQVAATRPLLGEPVDLLMWPEGGVDSDPLNDPSTAAALDQVAASAGAPLLMNAAVERDGRYFNSSMLWLPGRGASQVYDKRHPVPFGEYVPDRWLYGTLAPDLIGMLQRDYTAGTGPPVMDVGGVEVGLAICFDVIYDDVVVDGAREGALAYLFQTNNADFRGTDENLQQLAFARMRAIETGRSVVNLSTVGTSQVITPDGTVVDEIGVDRAGTMLTDVPLRSGLTPAVVVGPTVQRVIGWGSLLALAILGVLQPRTPRAHGRPGRRAAVSVRRSSL